MKLYGMPLSNYFNMVKHALLEKGIDFEIVPTPPGRDPEFLAKSPMGKIWRSPVPSPGCSPSILLPAPGSGS